MKLLYDISATDSSELHETLGFVDSDLDMNQLAQYIRSATRELLGYIGEANYKKATDFYEQEKYTEEFLILCKYAIGLNAWRKFAPLLDVSHTSQGRAFRADDQLKPAFEHQITNSDKAMEKNYYQAINEIFAFIMSTSGYEVIKEVQKFANLFVSSLQIFQNFVNINDSYLLFMKLAPALQTAENRLIKSRVGAKFQQYFEAENTTINDLIKSICVHYAMADGFKKLSVQLFPEGVFKIGNSSRVDVAATILYFEEELTKLLRELEDEHKKLNAIPSTKRMINFDVEDGFVTVR
jgi:vacuolar-type H+-ATPase subunit D/Vma8